MFKLPIQHGVGVQLMFLMLKLSGIRCDIDIT